MSGWYSPNELATLGEAAAAVAERGPIVEIGVYTGKSAAVLAKHAKVLYLVDNLILDGANSMMWPAGEGIWHVTNGTFPDITGVALLHHDADHTYPVVKEHLDYWLPRMLDGGLVALHDFHERVCGVERAWLEAAKGYNCTPFGNAGSLQVFEVQKP